MKTQVAIVGAGPAGLLLGELLQRRGIESVIVESRSRDYAEHRVRAGVLEHGTVKLLEEAGVADRLHREGLVHRGFEFTFDGRRHRIDLEGLTGRCITIYGQQEVVKDLIAARLESGSPAHFEARDVRVEGFQSGAPSVRFSTPDAGEVKLECDFIAGCDGFHGVCRDSIPRGMLAIHERVYPFAWLGILAQARPSREELVYANHDEGFALFSMRSTSLTRLYLQVPPDERLDAWPDARIWGELHRRLAASDGWQPEEGDILERMVAPMRSFVAEPMRCGRLFLAGDAAHIVPPTGAKGLNLAAADVWVLSRALARHYADGSDDLLDAYSQTCLRRVWRAEHFSWWMTSLLHRFPEGDSFRDRLQHAQLDYLASSRAAALVLAENYVGLPLDGL
ncbi:MAG TPA: 4-hydroxybenzoate 3-monooxygenase [Usitatibacter sp.]|nr:4-hydroxybenzoate 3-monooxygenase [Usitatibacter sp.]